VIRELRQKQLARADGGKADWEVQLEIRLYRERPSSQRPGKPVVGRLWDYLSQTHASKRRSAKKSASPTAQT